MKRLLTLLLLLASPAFATTTVTGTIQDLGTGTVGAGTYVRFWLRGCNGNQPRVNGTAIIAPSQGSVYYFDMVASSSGVISGTLYATRDSTGNNGGEIECGGSTTAEWYGMQVFVNGKGGPEVPIQAKNGTTLNISNVTPITTNPVATPPTGDTSYLRLDGGNSPVTGNVTFNGNVQTKGILDNGTVTASEPVTVPQLNTTILVDGTVYPKTAAGVTSAISALPASGGVLVIPGGISFGSTIVMNKSGTLQLGCGTFTGPTSGDIIDVQAPAVLIKGCSSMQNTGATQGTVLIAQTAAQANGIDFQSTGSGNVNYKVQDLSVIDSTAGGTTRTGGIGILADAAASPAQNSIGETDNVYVSYMYDGIKLNRPINSKVIRSYVVNSKSDGCITQGDGTTTTWDTVFCQGSGGRDYVQFGMSTMTYISPAAQGGTGGGIYIMRQSGTSGNQAIGTTINSPDIEIEGAKGIYCLDCIGLTVYGGNILNSTGDGIHLDGARGVTLVGGNVKSSGGCGVDVTQSATPLFPAAIVNQGMALPSNTGGAECGAALTASYSSLGYDSSGLTRLAYPLILNQGATFTGTVTGNNIPIVTSFTTTAATSDNVTVTGMTASGHCALQPTNATADTLLTGEYVSAKNTNQITVTHAATSGATFDVMCTPN